MLNVENSDDSSIKTQRIEYPSIHNKEDKKSLNIIRNYNSISNTSNKYKNFGSITERKIEQDNPKIL